MFWRRVLSLVTISNIATSTKLPPILMPRNDSNSLNSVNTTFNPCLNFYDYSCSVWLSHTTKPPHEPIWNPWIGVSHQIKRRISTILNRHDPTLTLPKKFYDSCVMVDNNEGKSLTDLISLVHQLGDWPLIASHKTNRDWLNRLSHITRLLGIHPIVKINVDLDYRDPTRVMIYVEPGSLIFPQYILTGRRYNKELEAYERWILDTIRHLYNRTNPLIVNDVREIVWFEMRLARLLESKAKSLRLKLSSLDRSFPGDWMGAFRVIFKGISHISPNTTVTIRNYSYLKNVALLIDKLGNRVVSNYLIWAVIKDLSRDTTSHMRRLNFFIDKAILGVEDDVSREHECLNKVIEHFSPLLLPQYLKSYVNPEIFEKITSMVGDIKKEFVNIIMESQWMSHEAKQLSSEKIKHIRLHLGYDRRSLEGSLQRFHKIQITDDHFKNMITLKQFKSENLLEHQKQTSSWPSTPFEVNAYYSVLQNAIFIPLGLLEPPFFDMYRNQVLNFGALGSLIGHELSHALDPAGISADSTGKITRWFPPRDLVAFKQRIRCFSDGNTLGENIADSNGLRISLAAMKKQITSYDLHEFFVSFAQMWCEVSGNYDIFTGEEHGFVSDRVRSLRNNTEFRETFHCTQNNSCELW